MRGVWWRVLLPALAGVAAVAPVPRAFVERLYAAGIYPVLQPLVTSAANVVPFALLDVMVAAAAAWLVWRTVARWRQAGASWIRRLLGLFLDILAGAAILYLLFLFLWGFNYRRERAETRLLVDASRVSAPRLVELADRATLAINATYRAARPPGWLTAGDVARDLAPAFTRAFRDLGPSWRPVPGRPKASLIAHLFPLAAVDGMINPWALEVLLNPEVLPFERPFVLAHEWAHLAGSASESEASFVGWLACLNAGRDAQYSAWLGIYLHVIRTLPAEERIALLASLDAGPRRDVDAIRERLLRARPAVQAVSWRAYDRYLRANRVESGIASYDEVVMLVLGSAHAAGHLPGADAPVPAP